MQKHFRYAIGDAILHQRDMTVGLYKCKYKTEGLKTILHLFDTDFSIGTITYIKKSSFIDVKLKITAKEWQIEIIKDMFRL
jgi:hypothetical protein